MATVIKPTMTIEKINKLLKNNRDIVFKSGTYELTSKLVAYSDTTITCEKNVVFKRMHDGRMLQLYVDKDTTGYNGTHNVTWIGGTFIANTNSGNANVIVVFHCKDIVLRDITIDSCVGLHSLEINASENVTVNRCKILNQTAKAGGDFREALQIDFAYKDGLSLGSKVPEDAPCYDGTHCKNLKISDCVFTNCPNGIGTHTVSYEEQYHEDIDIWGCDFNDIDKYAIKILGMKNVSVHNCLGGYIIVNKLKTAHKVVGGKVQLDDYRYNENVIIDNVSVI